MSDGLKIKTLHGLFWSFFERIGQQGIQFIISIILARLLMPEQFGLIAMLTIFMAVAQSIIDSGFGSALIQKQNANHLDECSIFYFNILVGFIAAGTLCLAAPWIAAFYKTPLLVPLTRLLSLNMIINSFRIIQITLLTKRIDFKTRMKISVTASVLSGFIGIAMAYQGYGVWSLVAQSICSNLFLTSLLWLFLPWRPSWIFSFTSLRIMFSFGSNLFFSGLLETIYRNLYLIVIGKLFSATDLGFYSRAKGLQQMPVENLSSAVYRVTFPVFSSIQENKARLKVGVRKALSTLAMVNFPLMIGLAVVAKPLVLVLLTDKWLPCVPYLQLLCVVGMLYPVHVINLNVLKAQGRSDLYFWLEIIKKVLTTIAILITWRWGITAMIYGQIATSTIAYYVNSFYTGKLISYPITEQIKDFIPSLGVASSMGVCVFLIGQIPFSNDLMMLTVQITTGVVLYITLCNLTKNSPFIEIQLILQSKFRLSNNKDY